MRPPRDYTKEDTIMGNFNVGNPVINLNLNVLTQTAIGIGNLGDVSNTALVGQFGRARFHG
jgi:hypothetical protein